MCLAARLAPCREQRPPGPAASPRSTWGAARSPAEPASRPRRVAAIFSAAPPWRWALWAAGMSQPTSGARQASLGRRLASRASCGSSWWQT
eukprot:6936835-Prymnesium_polylepis.1